MIRVHGHPATSLNAFIRNSVDSKGVEKRDSVLSKVQWWLGYNNLTLPHFANFNIMDLVVSSEVNPDKGVGAAGLLYDGKRSKKGRFLREAAILTYLLATKINKGEIFQDTSLYESGGRNKSGFGKKTGDKVYSRPVWMASPVAEIMSDFVVKTVISHLRKTGPENPLYVGKALNKEGWKKVVGYIDSTERICTHGDFSKYDSTIPRSLIQAAFCLFRTMFPKGKKWDSFCYFLYTGYCTKPIVTPGGHVYAFNRGAPSGHKLTSLINTFVNFCIYVCVLFEVSKEDYISACRKGIGQSPVMSMFLGDDFSVVSRYSEGDGIVRKMGEEYSSIVRKLFDMDLDPPYVGPFAQENPEIGGFEFLRVRFSKEGFPTVTGYEMVKRLVMPEDPRSLRDPRNQLQALSQVPSHPQGLLIWLGLWRSTYARKLGGYDPVDTFGDKWTESLKVFIRNRYYDEWYGKKAAKKPFSKGKVLPFIYLFKTLLSSGELKKLKKSTNKYMFSTFGASYKDLLINKPLYGLLKDMLSRKLLIGVES